MKKQDNILGVVPTPPHFVVLMISLIFADKSFLNSQNSSEMFILDSSVGDGRFLFEFAKLWMNLNKIDSSITLHGLDINQESIDKCKIHQKRFPTDSNIKFSFKTGNALIGDHKYKGKKKGENMVPIQNIPFHYYQEWPSPNKNVGYDICLGNPPFGLKHTDEEKFYFKQRYKSIDSEIESYILFVERSVELLRKRGLLVQLLPSNFATNYRYQEFRNFLYKNLAIQKIIMLTDKVFPKAAVETCILMAYKDERPIREKCQNIEFSEYSIKEGFSKIQKNPQNNLWEEEDRFLIPLNTSKHAAILETVTNNSISLGDIVNIARGIELGFHSELTSDIQISSYVPLVAGRNVHEFFIDEKIRYISFDKNQKSIFKDINMYKQPKIFLRRIGNRLIAAYDPNNLFCVCDVYILSLKPEWNHFNLRYLEMILNSSLLNFYLNHRFSTVKKLFPKIPISYLRQLPVKLPQGNQNRNRLETYLEGIGKLTRQESKGQLLEEIDRFICKIYNLSDDHIEMIKEYCKNEI